MDDNVRSAGETYVLAAVSTVVLGLLCAGYFVQRSWLSHDADEPQLVPYSLPIVANTLAYGKDAAAFFMQARKLFGPLRPFTCFVALQRFYIASDPFHSYHILKRPATYSFLYVIVGMMEPLFGLNKDGLDACRKDLTEDGYAYTTSRLTRDWLIQHSGDGSTLGPLERQYLRYLEQFLCNLKPGDNIGLLETTCEVICQCSVPLIHGEAGMHHEPNFAADFYTWADNMRSLMSGLPAQIFARTGFRARARLHRAIQNVLGQPARFAKVSDIIKRRVQLGRENGVAIDTIAQIDLGMMVALLANSAPAAFWMLAHACAVPELVDGLRAEIARAIARARPDDDDDDDDGEKNVFAISCRRLTRECPLLRSLWEEVLRFYQNSAQMRFVMEDGTIPAARGSDEKLKLKKGGLIQIPLRVGHIEPSIWGEDAGEFRPRRFMPGGPALDKQTEKMRQDAYRPFGSGLHLCPGRHFALVEVLAYVASVLWFFDVDFRGQKVPNAQLETVSLGIAHPAGDVRVTLSRRKGLEDARWTYVE